MSGGGGGYGAMIRNVYDQLPQNLGGGGAYPGQPQQPQNPFHRGGPAQGNFGQSYGQLGSYNTLAQDMSMNRTGAFGFGGQGGPFQYAAASGQNMRPGRSGYTGIGPFQNQGGGQVPGGFQTSMGTGTWPGFGQGGSPFQQPPYQYPGGGYGGAYGGGGFGMGGSPFFSGPGSYGSPGSMPFGGGSGMFSGGFGRVQRMQDQAQRYQNAPFTPGQRRPGSPTGVVIGQGGEKPGAPSDGNPDMATTNPVNPMLGGESWLGGGNQQITGGGSPNPFTSFPGAQSQVMPAQRAMFPAAQYLNFRSPFAGGRAISPYSTARFGGNPQIQQALMY